jgi:hypothetical protein
VQFDIEKEVGRVYGVRISFAILCPKFISPYKTHLSKMVIDPPKKKE